MVERGLDQADGLRRMFGEAHRPRVVEIVAGRAGVGRTSVAVNLGAALALRGCRTLLVDCTDRPGDGRARGLLGVERRESSRSVRPGAASVPECHGLSVIELAREHWPLSNRGRGAGPDMTSALLRETAAHDCILLTSTAIDPVLLSEDGRRDVVVVLSPAASSITDAYMVIKRIAAGSQSCRFHVVVNRVDSDAAALRIFDNVARVAHGFLELRLEMIGVVPADPGVERAAARGRCIVESDPRAPASRAFRQLADAVGKLVPHRHAPACGPVLEAPRGTVAI